MISKFRIIGDYWASVHDRRGSVGALGGGGMILASQRNSRLEMSRMRIVYPGGEVDIHG